MNQFDDDITLYSENDSDDSSVRGGALPRACVVQEKPVVIQEHVVRKKPIYVKEDVYEEPIVYRQHSVRNVPVYRERVVREKPVVVSSPACVETQAYGRIPVDFTAYEELVLPSPAPAPVPALTRVVDVERGGYEVSPPILPSLPPEIDITPPPVDIFPTVHPCPPSIIIDNCRSKKRHHRRYYSCRRKCDDPCTKNYKHSRKVFVCDDNSSGRHFSKLRKTKHEKKCEDRSLNRRYARRGGERHERNCPEPLPSFSRIGGGRCVASFDGKHGHVDEGDSSCQNAPVLAGDIDPKRKKRHRH